MSGHLSTHKGTPVLVLLKTGEPVEGKFFDKKSTYVIIEQEDGLLRIPTKNIRTVAIRKG